ncbi:MAG: hypothetical protein P8Y05_08120 [Deinococcales bacterium]
MMVEVAGHVDDVVAGLGTDELVPRGLPGRRHQAQPVAEIEVAVDERQQPRALDGEQVFARHRREGGGVPVAPPEVVPGVREGRHGARLGPAFEPAQVVEVGVAEDDVGHAGRLDAGGAELVRQRGRRHEAGQQVDVGRGGGLVEGRVDQHRAPRQRQVVGEYREPRSARGGVARRQGVGRGQVEAQARDLERRDVDVRHGDLRGRMIRAGSWGGALPAGGPCGRSRSVRPLPVRPLPARASISASG